MFGFGKSKRIATGIKDIQMAIISQSYIYLFLELTLVINRAHCITLEEQLQKKRNQT